MSGMVEQAVNRSEMLKKRRRKWLWRLTKQYLFEFRHWAKCSTCIKRDVCEYHHDMIQEIIVNGEERGAFEIFGVQWWRCSFYVKGELPDRSLKVVRK